MRIFLVSFFALCAAYGKSQQLTAFFDYKVFGGEGKTQFVETYLHFDGTSLAFGPYRDSLYQASVMVTIMFQQGENIVSFEKLTLHSPTTPIGGFPDFIDQRRFSLQPGEYKLEISLEDLRDTTDNKVQFSQQIALEPYGGSNILADIELLESATKAEKNTELTKAGYDMVPYVSAFYPQSKEEVLFYTEVYADLAEPKSEKGYIAHLYIEKAETGVVLSSLRKIKRIKPEGVSPILHRFNIASLPTGNYNVVVELRNDQNEEVVKKRQFIQREGTVANYEEMALESIEMAGTFASNFTIPDSLDEYIRSFEPISSMVEKRIIQRSLKEYNTDMKQRFIYSFWQARDAVDPGGAFRAYREKIVKTNNLFGMHSRPGYGTDRGRVYLQYGPPSSVVDRPNEPHSYPYQIWHYYKAGNFRNKRFVFVDRDLMQGNYQLLHSDVPGEINDRTWQAQLESRTFQRGNVDQNTPANNSWGTQSEELYQNPY